MTPNQSIIAAPFEARYFEVPANCRAITASLMASVRALDQTMSPPNTITRLAMAPDLIASIRRDLDDLEAAL